MKKLKRLLTTAGIAVIIMSLASSAPGKNATITVLDAKMAAGVDEKYAPVGARDTFPEETSKVFFWFSWKAAQKDAEIVVRWKYVTDDIQILSYPFIIPRAEGQGSIALSMPKGKALPPGLYKVDLDLDGRTLRSLNFTVLGK